MTRRWIPFVSAITWLILGISGVVGAQSADDIQVLSVNVDEHPTVEISVAIPPELGDGPLTGSDFAITEEGSPRPLSIQTVRDDIEVVLVIDTSGSMKPNDALGRAKAAAISLAGRLPESARVGVVGFGSEALIASPLTADRLVTQQAIEALDFSGDTALWDALVLSATVFEPTNVVSRYVVVLTDGIDDGSATDRPSATMALTNAEAALYAVGLETGQLNFDDLESLATDVGGNFSRAESIDALEPLYAEIGQRLTSRYRLVFDAEGVGERSIVISVATQGGLATVRRTIDVGGTAPVEELQDEPELAFPPDLNTRISPEVGALGQGRSFWAGTAALFASFAVLAFLIVRPAQQVHLATVSQTGDAVAGFSQRLTGTADGILAGSVRGSKLDGTLDAAGMEIRPGELVVFVLLGSLLGGLTGLALSGVLFAFVLAASVPLLAFAWVSRNLQRRRTRFADQLGGTLTIMAGALRAGRGLPQTLDLVADEMAAPTREEFQRVIIESRVGRDLSHSLESVASRMKNEDFKWIAEAIAINRELGGDLAEILDNIGAVVRDRNQIRQQVSALAAEGRLSGYVLIGLPISLFFYIQIVNPDYGRELLHGAGLVALVLAIVAIFGGMLWIRKLVNLNY